MERSFSYASWLAALSIALAGGALLGACGSSGTGSSGFPTGTGGKGGASTASGTASSMGGAGGTTGSFVGPSTTGSSMAGFDVQPTGLKTITVTVGQTSPVVKYTATSNGSPTSVTWSVDQGAIGTVPVGPASAATFTPTGTTGGLVNVTANRNGKTLQRQVFVKLVAPAQNGYNPNNPAEQAQYADPNAADVNGELIGGGGIGGVGGEGLGPAFTGFPTTTMPGSAMGLTLLYPYDKTVWPRGMLAPLLMWAWTPGDAEAIQISLSTTSGSFSWTGTFGKPAVIGKPGAPSTFIRSPIPQDVWTMATDTAGGATPNNMPDQLTLSLTVAKGGVAYGPVKETWSVAPAHLAGTVYYNSYGTGLVQNSTDHANNGSQYGAAVLAIKGGATAPVVVAGTSTPGDYSGSGCRVCHVVAGNGSLLIAQHGDVYQRTSSYDLLNGNGETVLNGDDSTFGWAGLSTDGSLALTNTAQLAAGQPGTSQLFAFPPKGAPATPLAVTGLPANFRAGAPAFSADGKHVAFELLGGTLGTYNGAYTGPSQLAVLDFDSTTMTFSNPRLLAAMPGGGGDGGQKSGLPSFFPTNDAVAFHNQLSNPSGSHRYNTWNGATAQVWWSDMATGTATNMATLNGLNGTTSYLPTNGSHPDDTTLNYEPTVNPIVSGGYAWIIFTTRRMYGNLATEDPTISDPRHSNYNFQDYNQVTCKKLWVAAVDIGSIKNGKFMEGVTPGTDPSHPAFYLGGQELAAGNARGFWVLDACKADGMSCQTGDQCCNGYCEPLGDGGSLVCGMPTGSTCSGLQEKCTTSADCCDTTNLCINGFCSLGQPPG